MASSSMLPPQLRDIKSLTFDLMGTCADYTTSLLSLLSDPDISSALPSSVDHRLLIRDWRKGFFERIFQLHKEGVEGNVDEIHRDVLDELLARKGVGFESLGDEERRRLVMGWHDQVGWPDAVEGISRLKTKYDCVVVANGTTRLQLDIASSSGLPFHALFSSQLIGHSKPDPEMYLRSIELLGRKPEEVAMVAAHLYDLVAAKKVGLRTIYIQRDTEDPDIDMELIRSHEDVDLFIDGRSSLGKEGGLNALATFLGV